MALFRQKFYWLSAGWIVLTLLSMYNLFLRPGLPVSLRQGPEGVFIQNGASGFDVDLPQKSMLQSLDAIPVKHLYEAEYIIDSKHIGDTVLIKLEGNKAIRLPPIRRYTYGFVLLNGLLGLCFILVGIFVWRQHKYDKEKHFAVSGLLFGFIIAMVGATIQLPWPIGVLLVTVYFISYPQAFLSFLYFSYYFPSSTRPERNLYIRRRILQILSPFLSMALIVLYFRQRLSLSPQSMAAYQEFYRVFRLFIFATLAVSLGNMFYNTRRDPNPVNRRKFQWVVWGVICGSFPFFFLWNLPQIFDFPPLIPEWFAYLFFVIIPVSIVVAIFKYRLFDIEVILSRSVVYGLVLAILLAVYLVWVGGLSILLFQQFSLRSPVLSLLAALLIALIFNPLRVRVQRVVDKRFFRIRYDQFHTFQTFLSDLGKISDDIRLIECLMGHFHRAVPLHRQLCLVKESQHWRPVDEHGKGDTVLQRWLQENLSDLNEEIVVNSNYLNRVEADLELAAHAILDPWVVMINGSDKLLWFLAEKQAGTRFWKEDLELARQMARATLLQLEKLNYIRLAVRESLEKEQAEKLSRWKSLLVAEVAHDLRAPLNTILWKLKNLQEVLSRAAPKMPIEIKDLHDQAQRLQHLVQSLLVLSDLEHGKLNLYWRSLNIKSEVQAVLQSLQGIIRLKNLKIPMDCEETLFIRGDSLILQEILLNILENAAKYSPKSSTISLKAESFSRKKKSWIKIVISDQGGGIPKSQLPGLFEPFSDHRGQGEDTHGFHLGMYIVKEFTSLLNGEVRVDSEPGKGTTVTLIFPGVPAPGV